MKNGGRSQDLKLERPGGSNKKYSVSCDLSTAFKISVFYRNWRAAGMWMKENG